MTGRARLGSAEWEDFPIELERTDVVAALAASHSVSSARGFSHYLDLPSTDAALPLELEFTDGTVVARGDVYRIDPEPDLFLLDTFTADPPVMVELARQHLRGRGLEFGALHSPLRVHESCRMQYADHYTNEELVEIFPEIERQYGDRMVRVDHRIDLNRSDLSELAAHGFDFFVANGVMEHLANPMRFLANVSGAMKPGAVLFVAVPDRDYAFDSRRALTSFDHLWRDFESGVTEPPDEHLEDYLAGLGIGVPDDPVAREAILAPYREQTYHVHVWDEGSFEWFLRTANVRVPLGFELVGGSGSRLGEGNIIAVLRKLPPE